MTRVAADEKSLVPFLATFHYAIEILRPIFQYTFSKSLLLEIFAALLTDSQHTT